MLHNLKSHCEKMFESFMELSTLPKLTMDSKKSLTGMTKKKSTKKVQEYDDYYDYDY